VRRHRAKAHRDIEDRIADELARTVIGDIATAVGVDKLCTDGLRIGKDVLALARTPRVYT